MKLDRQREILSYIIGYSDTMADSDFEDACDTLYDPTACDFNHVDYVIDMDIPAEVRAALFDGYETLLENYADIDFPTSWDFFKAITGSAELSVAGAVAVIPSGSAASSYDYVTADAYAAKHGVEVADILIVPGD